MKTMEEGRLEGKRKTERAKHLIVRALAGTGKTTTMILGTAYSFGSSGTVGEIDRRVGRIIPSFQQAEIFGWMGDLARDLREKSNGKRISVAYGAFNVSIVEEFKKKWSWLVDLLEKDGVDLTFQTLNSMGNSVCRRAIGWYNMPKSSWRTWDDLCEIMGKVDPKEMFKKDPVLMKSVAGLVEKSKLTLLGWTQEGGLKVEDIGDDALHALACQYEIELPDDEERVFDLVRKCLDKARKVSDKRIDFADQNWLPVVNGYHLDKVDLLIVDEAQDLNRVKQEFVSRKGRRLILVGDPHQAIYGFAGADCYSMSRMEREVLAEAGVDVLPLSVTFRCGKEIVALAKGIVSEYEAHESNPDGKVGRAHPDPFLETVSSGDMVLCRVNAPLVSTVFRLIKAGKKATIRGRDFGTRLVEFVEGFKAKDVSSLLSKLDEWADKEVAKERKRKRPSDEALIQIQDKKECLEHFCDGEISVVKVVERIKSIFDDQQGIGIVLSSVHRAKGLEADRIWVIQDKAPMPHPMAKSEEARMQERNLQYVAYTRAIHELVFVSESYGKGE